MYCKFFIRRQDNSPVTSSGGSQVHCVQQPGIPARSSSLNRPVAVTNPMPSTISQQKPDSNSEFVAPLNPVSRIHIRQDDGSLSTPSPSDSTPVLDQQRPLDKPTLVKPHQRTSVHIQPEIENMQTLLPNSCTVGEVTNINHPGLHDCSNLSPPRLSNQIPNQASSDLERNSQTNYDLQAAQAQAFYQQQLLHNASSQPIVHQPPPMPVVVNHAPSPMITPSRRISQTRNTNRSQSSGHSQYGVQSSQHGMTNDTPGIQTRHIPHSSPEKKVAHEVVPMNADKPTGLQLDEFLPRKFSGLGFNYNTKEGSGSKYSGFKSYAGMGEDMSESEVTSSIIKGHDGMMAVLTTRGRNMEIIQKLWQGKDAKAGIYR